MRLHVLTSSIACAALLFGLGTAAEAAPQSAVVSKTTEITATVETVNQETRTVLLSGPKGGLLTVEVGSAVKNLAQVKPGDHVVIRYREALAAEIVPSSTTTSPVKTETFQATVPTGHKPAGITAHLIHARVTIVSVDRKHNQVSFVGPARIERTVAVETPQMQRLLTTLKPGDQVEVTYSEAVAVSVEPAAN